MDQVLGTLGQGGRTRGTQLELQDICPVLVFNQGYQTQRQVAHVGMLSVNRLAELPLRCKH
mgnify:CR=1 FL=1